MKDPCIHTNSAPATAQTPLERLTDGEYNYLFHTALVIFAASLLLVIDRQTHHLPDKEWYLQPWLGAGIGLSLLLVFSLVSALKGMCYLFRIPASGYAGYVLAVISRHRVALFTSILFYLYTLAIPVIGFAPSTWMLTSILVAATRLANRFWMFMALVSTLAIDIIFRVAIGLWMDDVWLYEQLPDAMADFLNLYF